jgi:hypothetical protein
MYIADAVGIIVGTDGSDGRPRLTKRRTDYNFLFQKSLQKKKGEMKNGLSSTNYDGEERESFAHHLQ